MCRNHVVHRNAILTQRIEDFSAEAAAASSSSSGTDHLFILWNDEMASFAAIRHFRGVIEIHFDGIPPSRQCRNFMSILNNFVSFRLTTISDLSSSSS